MIKNSITKEIGEALKAKDEVRLSTLRSLSSALSYEKIAKQHDLTTDEELAVVKKEVKVRQDAIDSIHMAEGKNSTSSPEELSVKLKRQEEELAILKSYLPEEMPESELEQIIEQIVSETGASSVSDMGRVMSGVMAKVGARADGKKVAELVRLKLI